MTRKTILITGCSSGIGYSTAHVLRKRGWQVFASCRQAEDCERLRGEGFDAPLIDYTDTASIDAGVDAVLEKTGGRLDALFNNGAHGIPGLVEDMPTDALRAIFEANFFGWHSLTRRVIPVMREQGHGHIIQNSSVLGFVTLPYRGAYNSTKFALEGLTDTLRLELRGSGIHVCLVEPGPVRTKIRENSIPHFERWVDWKASAHASAYEDRLLDKIYKGSKGDPFELEPEAVAEKVWLLLESDDPAPRVYVTTPTYIMGFLKRLLPSRWMDRVLSKAG
jgi:NAD(P)-dependent dehydrogenase (short-subunit alcohol dehydrogenase family)